MPIIITYKGRGKIASNTHPTSSTSARPNSRLGSIHCALAYPQPPPCLVTKGARISVNSQGRCAKRRRRGTWRGGRGADQPLPSSSRYDLYALYARCGCSSMRHHHARTRGGWVDNMKECAFTHIYARLYARSVSPLPLFGSGCNRQPALWPVRVVSVAERPFDRSRPCDLVRAARRRFPHGIKSFGAFYPTLHIAVARSRGATERESEKVKGV